MKKLHLLLFEWTFSCDKSVWTEFPIQTGSLRRTALIDIFSSFPPQISFERLRRNLSHEAIANSFKVTWFCWSYHFPYGAFHVFDHKCFSSIVHKCSFFRSRSLAPWKSRIFGSVFRSVFVEAYTSFVFFCLKHSSVTIWTARHQYKTAVYLVLSKELFMSYELLYREVTGFLTVFRYCWLIMSLSNDNNNNNFSYCLAS